MDSCGAPASRPGEKTGARCACRPVLPTAPLQALALGLAPAINHDWSDRSIARKLRAVSGLADRTGRTRAPPQPPRTGLSPDRSCYVAIAHWCLSQSGGTDRADRADRADTARVRIDRTRIRIRPAQSTPPLASFSLCSRLRDAPGQEPATVPHWNARAVKARVGRVCWVPVPECRLRRDGLWACRPSATQPCSKSGRSASQRDGAVREHHSAVLERDDAPAPKARPRG
mgnify:CR=1 FL=1